MQCRVAVAAGRAPACLSHTRERARGCLWQSFWGGLAGGMEIEVTAREYGISQEDVRAGSGTKPGSSSQEDI